jgi:hypothetical protein
MCYWYTSNRYWRSYKAASEGLGHGGCPIAARRGWPKFNQRHHIFQFGIYGKVATSTFERCAIGIRAIDIDGDMKR